MVQAEQEETVEDQIQAVTGVYGLCCSHLVRIQKKKKKCASAYFASPLQYCCPPLSHLNRPTVSSPWSFISLPPNLLFCVSPYAYLYVFQFPLSPRSLLFSSSILLSVLPPSLAPLSLFSKLIALKHSLLLTSTPLCPPQSHITQSPLVLTSFCT